MKTRRVSKRTGGVIPNMPVTDGRKQHWSVKDPLQSREFIISL